MGPASEPDRGIVQIAALDQPLRRDLYRLLSGAGGWTSRDDAAEAIGVPRSVAAFHLDKLAEAGVVEFRFERTGGRSGPGAGRPSKLYRLAGDEVSASVPDRRYGLAGALLATAVAEATGTGAPVADCLRAAALARGRRVGEEAAAAAGVAENDTARRRAVVDVLARQGYEPEAGRRKEVVLTNCPFHRLAEEHRALVCGMNLDFLEGVLEGLGATGGLQARLAPEPGYCCVRLAVG
jgi:predicted ArsR family transcriptional regulator